LAKSGQIELFPLSRIDKQSFAAAAHNVGVRAV
jgi:hypothetical protein